MSGRKQSKIESAVLCGMFHTWGINRMKRLKDFKITERISCQTIEVLPMQFGFDEATRRIAMHHAKRVILKHREEIQKLAYK